MASCSICGLGLVPSEEKTGICFACAQKQEYMNSAAGKREAEEREKRQRLEVEETELAERIDSILLTTETNPPLNITDRLEIITAECVYGMNIFRDIFTSVRDIVGGRSGAMQKVLRDARKQVLYEIRKEAYSIGANGVIAVRLDYSEFSGKDNAMLFVVASGTAVTLGDASSESA